MRLALTVCARKLHKGKLFTLCLLFVHRVISEDILLSVIESSLGIHPELLNIQVS